MEVTFIHLDIHTSKYSDQGDAGDCYNRYDYDVYLINDDDEKVLIGKGSAVLYQYSKMLRNGYDPIDAFDDNHHEEIYDLLFDGDYVYGTIVLKSDWEEMLLGSDSWNILVKDRLEILPEFRHKGYGKEVRSLLRSFFDGCYGIEVLKSFPLQLEPFDNAEGWRSQLKYDEMEQDEKKAQDSLNRCYKKDGYKQYKKTSLFYRLHE